MINFHKFIHLYYYYILTLAEKNSKITILNKSLKTYRNLSIKYDYFHLFIVLKENLKIRNNLPRRKIWLFSNIPPQRLDKCNFYSSLSLLKIVLIKSNISIQSCHSISRKKLLVPLFLWKEKEKVIPKFYLVKRNPTFPNRSIPEIFSRRSSLLKGRRANGQPLRIHGWINARAHARTHIHTHTQVGNFHA